MNLLNKFIAVMQSNFNVLILVFNNLLLSLHPVYISQMLIIVPLYPVLPPNQSD